MDSGEEFREQIKGLIELNPNLEIVLSYIDKHNEESDLGKVLVASAVIEGILKEILKSFFIDNKVSDAILSENNNGALGSFSSRAQILLLLGFLSEREYNNCRTIMKIRNDFAHKPSTRFKNQNIKDLCENLVLDKQYNKEESPQKRFVSAAISLITKLSLERINFAEKNRCPIYEE